MILRSLQKHKAIKECVYKVFVLFLGRSSLVLFPFSQSVLPFLVMFLQFKAKTSTIKKQNKKTKTKIDSVAAQAVKS